MVEVGVHFLVLVLQGADKFCVLTSAQEVYRDFVCKSGRTMPKDGGSSVAAAISSLVGTSRMGVNR